jgi:hypothetical protein
LGSKIDARKLDLKAVRDQKYEDLRAELIDARLEQIEREPVLIKIGILSTPAGRRRTMHL